jgi:hypothetical protein
MSPPTYTATPDDRLPVSGGDAQFELTDPAFWSMVDTSGDCWEWRGHLDRKGYGRLRRHAVSEETILAHRYAWMLAHGEMPPSALYVCHRCDNPPCVNPDHLFLGTPADNSADCVAKGRHIKSPYPRGETHPEATYSDAVVRELREAYARGGETQCEIASRLGVNQTVVGKWVRGETRVDAGGPFTRRRRRRGDGCGGTG